MLGRIQGHPESEDLKGLEESWLYASPPSSPQGQWGLFFGIRVVTTSLWVRGQRLMELEEVVSGHIEISNGPGIWSWVGLSPKEHGFPTMLFWDICTDYVPHSACLSHTANLCGLWPHCASDPEAVPTGTHCILHSSQFYWSTFISQLVGTTQASSPLFSPDGLLMGQEPLCVCVGRGGG